MSRSRPAAWSIPRTAGAWRRRPRVAACRSTPRGSALLQHVSVGRLVKIKLEENVVHKVSFVVNANVYERQHNAITKRILESCAHNTAKHSSKQLREQQ